MTTDNQIRSLENRLLSANADIQSSHKREKEAHNAAIEKVTESLQRRVEFGHLEIDWEYVVQELDKLKI